MSGVTIRPEAAQDIVAIREINIAAFRDHPQSQQTEHLIVEAMRAADALELSLVAVSDDRAVGHIAFSRAAIGAEASGWFLLGPVAVLPPCQRQGVGSALVTAGLVELRRRGAEGCVVVGDPGYYCRFGFRTVRGVTYEGVPERYVLCLLLQERAVPRGQIRAHEAFLTQAADNSSRGTSRVDFLVETLGLQPHPEGGFYREVFRSPVAVDPGDGRRTRSALTTIYFLLPKGSASRLHRVQSDEAWHFYEGSGLRLTTCDAEFGNLQQAVLGPLAPRSDSGRENCRLGAEPPRPVHVVSAGWWQAAEPLGDYALAGCTVGPGFDFADFTLLADDEARAAAFLRLHHELKHLLLTPGTRWAARARP